MPPPSSSTANLSPAVPNISASPTPPPTYRVRTMAGDLGAGKKSGGATPPSRVQIAPEPPLARPAGVPPVNLPLTPNQIKPSFPKPSQPTAVLPQTKEPPTPVFSLKPQISQSQPFSAPLGKPMTVPPIPPMATPRPTIPPPQPKTPIPPVPSAPYQAPVRPAIPPSFSIPPRPTTPVPPPPPAVSLPTPPPALPISPAMPPRPVMTPTPPMPTRPAPPPPTRPSPPTPPAVSLSNPLSPLAMPPARTLTPPVTGGPSLPPLGPAKPKKKKLILLMGLAVVALALIGGEIWWFFLRTEPTPPPADLGQTLPPPENIPLLPPAENVVPPPVTASPEIGSEQTAQATPGLLLYTDLILSGDPAKTGGLTAAVAELTDAGLGKDGEDEIKRLIFSPTGEPSDTISLSFANLLGGLKIRMPLAVKNELMESRFDMFAFGGTDLDKSVCEQGKNMAATCYGPRLGLVFDVSASDKTKLTAALRAWEKTMISDLKPLILARTGTLTGFKTGTYQGQTIRYQNLPINTITIDYAIVDDLLIITTSKSAMLKAIDSVPAPGEG